MSFDRYFIASSYLLMTVSFLMLAATGRCDFVTLILFLLVLIGGWLIDNEKWSWTIPPKIANLLILVALPVAFFEWQILQVMPVAVIIHFVLFTSSLKLLRRKSDRDWLWLYIVSFCQVVITSAVMIGTNYLILFVLYFFAAISTFVAYEIRSARQVFRKAQEKSAQSGEIEFWKEEGDTRREYAKPRWRTLSYFSAIILILILLTAVPIFLAMPRLTRGFIHNGFLATGRVSGFSDTVRLGEIARVKLNPQVVMRVRVKFPLPIGRQNLKWRGVTLDNYDGQFWSESSGGPLQVKRIANSFRIDDKMSPRGFTQQHFFVEPLNISAVFAAPRPVFLTGLSELARDNGDGLWTEDHLYQKIDYVVYSDTSIPDEIELAMDNSRAYPLEIRQRYLQLPHGHDRRIDDLALEVTQGVSTQFEIARRIERFLSTSYSYTLDLRRVEDGDPVADFLFNTQAGHCEYFASAMVLMLRTRQVPARLVNGFQMGEYNNSADIYTVRQSDAHSWVEVYFRKHGWVAFDPTPAAGMSVYANGWTAWLRHYGEALEMFWLEHIVGFDTTKQVSMVLAIQQWLSSYQRNASSRWMDWALQMGDRAESLKDRLGFSAAAGGQTQFTEKTSAVVPVIFSIAGLGVVAAAVLIRRKRRNSQLWRSGVDASISAVAFYHEMVKTLERIGYQREPQQTPAEFAAQLAIPSVHEITFLYQRTRFGCIELSEQEITRVGVLLEELKRSEKRKKKKRDYGAEARG
jgi:protein-glutamine gamma-glutamyltransferase